MNSLLSFLFLGTLAMLFVSFVVPKKIEALFKMHLTIKKVRIILILIALFCLFAITPETQNTPKPTEIAKEEDVDVQVKETPIDIEETVQTTTDKNPVTISTTATKTKEIAIDQPRIEQTVSSFYTVTRVVDGDTIDVLINNKTERVRLIGINTPETKDPRKSVECFGEEASNKMVELAQGKKVELRIDKTQDEKDKYGRLLRYVIREDGLFINKVLIEQGYAHEYTYRVPYEYQREFRDAQETAETHKLGLWANDACKDKEIIATPVDPSQTPASITAPPSGCTIKGNISTTKEKIYHVQGCGSYEKTTIKPEDGEKWFCTEQEAIDAGWRKAGNC